MKQTWFDKLVGVAIFTLLFSLLTTKVCSAEDLPFALKCPDVLQCTKNAPGDWVPSWYIADVAEDQAKLQGALDELDKAQQELEAFRKVHDEYKQRVEDSDQMVVEYERILAERDEQLRVAQHRAARRFRWGLGSTVTSVLLLGVLSAGIYAATH
jgi:hypothetical protein